MRRLTFVIIWLWCGASTAFAQEHSDHDGWSFNLVHENDLFENGHDRNYTSGVLLSAVTHRDALKGLEEDIVEATGFEDDFEDVRMEIALSHSMFTPRDLTIFPPDPDDRPYAGMATLSVGFVGSDEEDGRFDSVTFSLGVVGPSSRADDIQSWLHEEIRGVDPIGWPAQIDDRIVGGVAYQQTRRAPWFGGPGAPFDVFGHAGFSLGTIQTNVSIGASLRVGYNRPVSFGLPRLSPSVPGSGYFTSPHNAGWYAFVGGEQRYVAYDVGLDENPTFGPSNISRRDFVGDLQAGVMAYWGPVRVSYTHIWRSEQFRSQQEGDGFGAVAIGVSTGWGAARGLHN